MLEVKQHFNKLTFSVCAFTLLASGCGGAVNKEPVKRTEILVYHVSGLTIPDKKILEKCKQLGVRIKMESCVMNNDFVSSNRYVDSIVNAEYGISVREILIQ